MAQQGHPLKIQAEHLAMLVAIVESDATSTLDEIGTEFTRRTGLEVHAQTIVSALRKAGVERVASSAAVTVEIASKGPRRGTGTPQPIGALSRNRPIRAA